MLMADGRAAPAPTNPPPEVGMKVLVLNGAVVPPTIKFESPLMCAGKLLPSMYSVVSL